jgi:hypothetical protein
MAETEAHGRKLNRTMDAACLALLMALAAAYVWPALFGGKAFGPYDLLQHQYPWGLQSPAAGAPHNPEPQDFVHQFYPWRMHYARSIRGGEAPLWNPHQFCGQPFAANDQSAVFYPPNLLFAWMPVWRAFGFSALLHLFLAGGFMFLFARVLGAGRAGGLAAGAAFMLCGWMTAWLAHPAKITAAAWAPLVFLSFELALRRGGARRAALCAAAFGIQLTAGFLQVASYTFYGLIIYAAVRMATSPGSGRLALRRVVGLLASTGLGGALLAAVHVLPVLDLARQAQRPALSHVFGFFSQGLPVKQIAALLLPDLFGNPAAAGAARMNYTETCAYAGAAALCLAATALLSLNRDTNGAPRLALRTHRDSAAAALGAVAAVALLSSFGTPVHFIYYKLVPGAETLAVNRMVFLFMFAAAALSALGVQALMEKARAQSMLFAACAALTAAALVFVFVWPRPGAATSASALLTFLAPVWCAVTTAWVLRRTPRAAGLVLAVIVAADLFAWGHKYNTYSDPGMVFPETPAIRFLEDKAHGEPFRIQATAYDPGARRSAGPVLFPNTATAYGIDDFRGYDSLYLKRYQNFMQRVHESAAPTLFQKDTVVNTPVIDSPWLDFMNVRYLVSLAPPPADGRYQGAHYTGRGMPVYRNRYALPRAFVVRGWRVRNGGKAVLDEMFRPDFNPARQAVLEAPPPGLPDLPDTATGPGHALVPAAVIGRGPNHIAFRAQGPGLLVTSEAWAPGWTAMNGLNPRPVLRANYIFRAVPVPEHGEQIITMRYTPGATVAGLFLSFGALAMLMFIFVVEGIKPQESRG